MFVDFINLCFLFGTTLPTWKKSNIYPIPKNKDWSGDLSNTRPIILIETARKILTKILTLRLAAVCKNHEILKGPNFAGLPGESTSEPIHLINNICEEARETKKELWILFQDTAKAFDTVNLEMLEKAMQRIKVPPKAISLITNLFKDRELRVITKLGLTDSIQAGDGIDQGETISPLLWRIFYDPLLCKIQENQNYGYEMGCSWKPDLANDQTTDLKLRCAALAYMNDTTWIARSKDNMERILKDAREFYKANDSQINSNKSVLIAINSDNHQPQLVHAGINEEEIRPIDKYEFARFLGVWVGKKKHTSNTKQRLEYEISNITRAIARKKITSKQTLYILNKVLIPRIEYRTQHCFLSEGVCNSLTSKYRKVLKNKSGICNTIPNSAVHHKGLLKLKSVWEIQTESQISNLTNRLNDMGPAGKSTLIRLKQAQITNWEPTNLLTGKIPEELDQNGNFSLAVLKQANKLGIRYHNSSLQKVFEWAGGSNTIQSCLNDAQLYKKSRKSLKKREIMFVDQLVDKETYTLTSWNYIKVTNGIYGKGPTPLWYKKIKQIICKHDDSRLNTPWQNKQWTTPTPKMFNELTEDKRKKEWCCSLDKTSNRIIWGKVIESSSDGKTLIAKHFTSSNGGKKDLTILTQCQGCNLNKSKDPLLNMCLYKKQKKDMITPKYLAKKKAQEEIIKIPCDTYILERNLEEALIGKKREKLLRTGPSHFMHVEIMDAEVTSINKLISSEDHKRDIVQALLDNQSKNTTNEPTEYEFYTDGSLKMKDSPEVKMDAAAIQTKGPNPGSTLMARVKNWPSAARAEATAIAIAILTVPSFNKVTICTDSQNCIDTFQRLSTNDSRITSKRWLKMKNWYIWAIIIEAIERRRLEVSFKKVKAHANDELNKKADRLAKLATLVEPLTWNSIGQHKINVVPVWEGIICEENIRNLVKDLNQKSTIIKWTKQQRVQKLLGEQVNLQTEYEWSQLWKNIGAHGFNTSAKENKRRGFWIKLIHNELPTLDRLAIRKPGLYSNFKTCCICHSAPETREHLFICEGLNDRTIDAWQQARDKTMEKILKNINENQKILKEKRKKNRPDGKKNVNLSITEDLGKIEKTLDSFEEKTFGSMKRLMLFTMGLIEKKEINALKKNLNDSRGAKAKATELMVYFSQKFREGFRKEVWNNRCKIINEADKTRGISSKEKKKKNKGIRSLENLGKTKRRGQM